jgi:hypothetical protein
MSRDTFEDYSVIFAGMANNPLATFASQPLTIVNCPVSYSEKYAEALEQLNAFSRLDDNWDGYGGARISDQAIAHARSLLCTQIYTYARLGVPEITPTPNGTLVVEWQGSNGEAAVEIGNTRVSGVVKAEKAPTMCISGDTAQLSEYLPIFIAPFLNPEARKAAAITPVEYEAAANV